MQLWKKSRERGPVFECLWLETNQINSLYIRTYIYMRVGLLLPSRITRPVFSDYHSRHMDMQFLDHNWSNSIRVFSSFFRWRQVEGHFIRSFFLHLTISVDVYWYCIIHDVWHLLILSNEEKTNDYENFEKGMIYMKILKKGGGGGNEIHAPCACASD